MQTWRARRFAVNVAVPEGRIDGLVVDLAVAIVVEAVTNLIRRLGSGNAFSEATDAGTPPFPATPCEARFALVARLDSVVLNDAVAIVVDRIARLVLPRIHARFAVVAVAALAARSQTEPIPVIVEAEAYIDAGFVRGFPLTDLDAIEALGAPRVIDTADGAEPILRSRQEVDADLARDTVIGSVATDPARVVLRVSSASVAVAEVQLAGVGRGVTETAHVRTPEWIQSGDVIAAYVGGGFAAAGAQQQEECRGETASLESVMHGSSTIARLIRCLNTRRTVPAGSSAASNSGHANS